MKTKRLLVFLCSLYFLLFSLTSIVEMFFSFKETLLAFEYYYIWLPKLASTNIVYFFELIGFILCSFLVLIYLPIMGTIGIISIYKKRFLKLNEILGIISLPLIVIYSVFCVLGEANLNNTWYSILCDFSLIIFVIYFLYSSIKLEKSSYENLWEPPLKRVWSLQSTIAILIFLSGLFFATFSCISLYMQNFSKAGEDRKSFALESAREMNSFVSYDDIQKYIDGDLDISELRSYQEYFAYRKSSNEAIAREYIIIPYEDRVVIILNDGLLTNPSIILKNSVGYDAAYESLAPNNTKLFKATAIECYKNSKDEIVDNINGKNDKDRLNTAFYPLKGRTSNKAIAVCCVDFYSVSYTEGFDINLFYNAEAIFSWGSLLTLISVSFAGLKIVEPILTLNDETKKIVSSLEDDTSLFSLTKTKNEIGELSQTFENVTNETRAYIKKLETVENEKSKLKTELDIAKKIQSSFLPTKFLKSNSFDLFAFSEPARDVGGDFYDFFKIDEDHLAILVADVSGKGVPAALFMAMSKSILQVSIKNEPNLTKAVEKTNIALCGNNKEGMFITSFVGVVDLRSGMMEYVNAGHIAPLIKHLDDKFISNKVDINLLLARFKKATYSSNKIQLSIGDTVILYSDGATDVTNLNGERLKVAGLIDIFNRIQFKSTNELLTKAKMELEIFEEGNEKFDDITILALTYKGYNSLHISSSINDYDKVERYLENQFDLLEVDKSLRRKINTITDEIFRNISSYAYDNLIGDIELSLMPLEDEFILTFIDNGIEFDFTKENTSLNKPLEDLKKGGMGIHIIKSISKDVRYMRLENKNITKIVIGNR